VTSDEVVPESPPVAELPDPDSRRTIALIVGVIATVLFVILRFVVALDDHKPLGVDVWWHEQVIAGETDWGIFLAWVPSNIGGTIGGFVMVLLLVLALLWRKRRWDALNLAAATVVVVAIGAPMAAIIARVRPDDSLAESVATSFPSGHTAVATTVVITLGLLLRRWYVWVIGAVWVVWMMWARTYLHAHWLSDVVAGLLEGIAVATLVWCAVEAIKDRRARKSVDAEPSAS
jgi:membrane-associated phospholipid phosphatase